MKFEGQVQGQILCPILKIISKTQQSKDTIL